MPPTALLSAIPTNAHPKRKRFRSEQTVTIERTGFSSSSHLFSSNLIIFQKIGTSSRTLKRLKGNVTKQKAFYSSFFRTIERLDPREANEQALKEVLKDEVEPVKKIFKERADYENDPPTERLSRSQSMDCDFEEIVKSQLIELSEKLYQGQLSNVDEIEALQARISSAEVMPTCEVSIFTFNIDQLRGLIIEVTDSIMDKNIKNPSQLRPPNREKFYDVGFSSN